VKSVARHFGEPLVVPGMKRSYGIADDSLDDITDGIRREGTIEWLHVRREEAAGVAGGGEMNPTAERAVCARSCSPGNTPNQRSLLLSPVTVWIATRDFRLRPAPLRSENASEEPVSRAQPVNIRSRELIKSEFILRRSRCHGLALILPVIGRGGTRRRNRGFTVKHKASCASAEARATAQDHAYARHISYVLDFSSQPSSTRC
jgi:hypothetical protein